MKKITFILILLLANFTEIFAQFRNNGAAIVIQPGATLKIDTDFYNGAGSDFQNNSKVILTKNVVNNQVMAEPTVGDWEFSGTTNQVISGVSFLKVFNGEFANNNGIKLNNVLRVVNQAKFTNGLVEAADPYALYFGPNATIPITPTDINHVVGTVVKEGMAPFTYPVGDMWSYQPVKVDFTTNTTGLGAKYVYGDAGAGAFTTAGSEATSLTAYNTNEYWDLNPVGGGTTTANVTMYWDGYKDTNPNLVATRRVAHKVGGNWLNEGLTANAMGTLTVGSVKSNLITSWSPFTLGFVVSTPLPLKLLSFTANATNDGNKLNWLTTNEIGASHFEIERSETGKTFDKIGEVKANGGPSENVGYEYIDQQTNSQLITHNTQLYYRLKMVDLDGKYTYSKIVAIKNESNQNADLKLYPNPAISVLNIENSESDIVEVSNINGQKTLFNVSKTNNSNGSIDVSQLPTGLYFLKAGNEVKKFLKQ